MELKTLKDFETDSANLFCDDAVIANDLRQEAIRWIKEWKKEQSTPHCDADYYQLREEKIRLFKEFFNITEEDLNEENNQH